MSAPVPTRADLRAVQANHDRLRSYLPPRVECGWCGSVLARGEGATSHGICEGCTPLATEPITAEMLIDLHERAEIAWHLHQRGTVTREAWERRERRFKTAVRLLFQDRNETRDASPES